jgi:hypothetical protein
MSGVLHKAEDALHIHHHDNNKPTEHGEHAKQPDAHAGKYNSVKELKSYGLLIYNRQARQWPPS